MLNQVTIMGRLTKEPELQYTANGIAYLNFSIASESDYKDKGSGERSTSFFDCIAWRQTAEFISKYFTKGRMMIINGSLESRNWTDKDTGKNRTAVQISVSSAYFGDSPKEVAQAQQPPQSYGQSSQGQGYRQPSQGQGYGQPSQGQGYGQPSQGQGNRQPSQGQGNRQPSQGQGYGQPSQGQGYGQPSQGQGYGQPPQGYPVQGTNNMTNGF